MYRLPVSVVENRLPRGILAGAAALAMGMWAVPAWSQLAPGYSGSSSTIVSNDNEQALRMLSAFATCYARTNAEDGFALLATDPGSRAEAETYRRMFRRGNQACLGDGTSLSVPVAFVRGAIAEALFERGAIVPPGLLRPAPVPGAEIRKYSEAARCYAAGHGAEIRRLLDSSPGGRRELDALQPLVVAFFRCMPASGQGRRFNATHLRYMLAEALLRLPPPSTAQAAQR